jgi:hypothetical protein
MWVYRLRDTHLMAIHLHDLLDTPRGVNGPQRRVSNK